MVKLVARFYDPTAGAVCVDGADLRELDLLEYRAPLGVVPQEAYLFAGTVRDAIAYGRPDATDAEVEAAARAVGAHDDGRRRCPAATGTRIGERGRALSAGQRQLLALARAELVDPDVLLFDEATASLDLATEAAVTRAADARRAAAGRRWSSPTGSPPPPAPTGSSCSTHGRIAEVGDARRAARRRRRLRAAVGGLRRQRGRRPGLRPDLSHPGWRAPSRSGSGSPAQVAPELLVAWNTSPPRTTR